MSYVRVRGNQLAIVHGAREPGTGKVQQQILFTIYSKPEALAICGPNGNHRFRAFWAHKYPDIKLDWKKIGRAIADHSSVLPDHYDYGPARLRERFHGDLCSFARQLILTDPQDLATSAKVLQDHRRELTFLADLISWRLKLCDREQSEWTADDEFCWKFALRGWGRRVPPEIEEQAADLYNRHDYDHAAAIFQLLIDCFDSYADGYNYLGLIALARNDHRTAIAHFEKTIELGRKLFPAKLARKHYWSDHDTRPYMRGLRNLTLALVEHGRFDDALRMCDRLEQECGDVSHAVWHRSTIGLNTRDWAAVAPSEGFLEIDPSSGFLVAFAEYERGRLARVLPAFLHAALNTPRAARMLADKAMAMRSPVSYDDASDHNTGVSLSRALHTYQAKQSRRAKQFFRTVIRDPRIARLLDEVIALREVRVKERGRAAFDRLREIQSSRFAATQASDLADLTSVHRPPSELSDHTN
jgi:tetratricopeptide (TPR) repeat protein